MIDDLVLTEKKEVIGCLVLFHGGRIRKTAMLEVWGNPCNPGELFAAFLMLKLGGRDCLWAGRPVNNTKRVKHGKRDAFAHLFFVVQRVASGNRLFRACTI